MTIHDGGWCWSKFLILLMGGSNDEMMWTVSHSISKEVRPEYIVKIIKRKRKKLNFFKNYTF